MQNSPPRSHIAKGSMWELKYLLMKFFSFSFFSIDFFRKKEGIQKAQQKTKDTILKADRSSFI